jgi:hypothetical protein
MSKDFLYNINIYKIPRFKPIRQGQAVPTTVPNGILDTEGQQFTVPQNIHEITVLFRNTLESNNNYIYCNNIQNILTTVLFRTESYRRNTTAH